MHTSTAVCCIAVVLIAGFHLTAACWAMLGGRNKELDKLCSTSLLAPPCVRARIRESHSSQTSRRFVVFVLFCLLYKWWSSGQEREKHSTLPGGNARAAGHRPPQHHPPPPTIMPRDRRTRTACACVWPKRTIRCVALERLLCAFCCLCTFIDSIEFVIHKKLKY